MAALGRCSVCFYSRPPTSTVVPSLNGTRVRSLRSGAGFPAVHACPPSRLVVAGAGPGNGGEGFQEADDVLAEFFRHVESTKQPWPLEGRRPTALMPPTTIVRVLMDALMRNDWPEDNSGIHTAFSFAMPPAVNEMIAGQVGQSGQLARAWYATEKYLSFSEFAEVIRGSTYSPMLNFTNWEVASPLTFHGPGDKRAVQAVKTTSQLDGGKELSCTYTFCLEKVLHGIYRGCWLVVGVRVGDYANV